MEKSGDDALLHEALRHSEEAFKDATGLNDGIENQQNTKKLLDRIESSPNKSLIDTIESLIQAEEMLLGWFIDRRTSKTNVKSVADNLGRNWKTIRNYLERLRNPENVASPFRHLLRLLDKKPRGGKPR